MVWNLPKSEKGVFSWLSFIEHIGANQYAYQHDCMWYQTALTASEDFLLTHLHMETQKKETFKDPYF